MLRRQAVNRLFNRDGEVIGIAVATLADADGIGWAVPVDLIRRY
jgi:S1-C subfamily serine protease